MGAFVRATKKYPKFILGDFEAYPLVRG